jgi:class 3 adenylate cyclase/pimeloyl-ACP methyl ester carboxylesterase
VKWETRYARAAGDLNIAYQVAGQGPRNVVIAPLIVSHIEYFHEVPGYTRWLDRFAAFARVAVFDKRGQGMSDRCDRVALLEERVDDIRAVMDACDMADAAIVGLSEGGSAAMLMGAMHPDRVTALVLCGTSAAYVGDPAEGAFMVADIVPEVFASFVETWGSGTFLSSIAPSLLNTPHEALLGRMERYGSTRGAIRDVFDVLQKVDVRAVLGTIRAPTIVVRRSGEMAPESSSRYLTEHIPGARYVEVPGIDHVPYVGDVDAYVDPIEEFLTGSLAPPDDVDRVLATVLFTDIVGSTERAAELGDRKWHVLLDSHDRLIREAVDRHRGRLVNTTGDGAFVTFDGPARAIRCGVQVSATAPTLGLDVRTGIHTGECDRRGDDLAGIAVHIGARVASLAGAGEVLVTKTVRDLVVGSEFEFDDRGRHELKGVPGDWELLAVAR